MRHLMEKGMPRGLKGLEMLAGLAPAAAFVAVVLFGIKEILRLVRFPEQRADLHHAWGLAILRPCVGDGKTAGAFTLAVGVCGALDGEVVGYR